MPFFVLLFLYFLKGERKKRKDDNIFVQKMAASDLFILPSESESFGLAALEAMAAKIPVISTNTGGIPEVNESGVSGFLSNVGDVKSMAENALKILSDEVVLEKFKKGAYQQAEKFDLNAILPLYEKLYKRVIN